MLQKLYDVEEQCHSYSPGYKVRTYGWTFHNGGFCFSVVVLVKDWSGFGEAGNLSPMAAESGHPRRAPAVEVHQGAMTPVT